VIPDRLFQNVRSSVVAHIISCWFSSDLWPPSHTHTLHGPVCRVNPFDALVSSSKIISQYYFSAGWLCCLWLLVDYVRTSGSIVWVAEFLTFPAFWPGVPLFGVKKFISSICSGNAWIQIWAGIWIHPQSSGNHFFKWRAYN